MRSSFRRHSAAIAAVVILLSFGSSSCASKKVAPISETDLPKLLPQELQTKFEVKDAPQVQPTPSPTGGAPVVAENSPSPEKKPKKKKKSRHRRKKDSPAVAEAPPVFTYPDRRVKDVNPVWLGEKMGIEITYLGMAAGMFTAEVLPYKAVGDRKVYHLKGTAESSKFFSLFYKLDDWIESFFDYQGLFSYRFHLVLDETRQSRDALELYDSEKKETFYFSKRNHYTKGYSEDKSTGPISSFPQDSFSALYYIRFLPLEVGQTYTFPVVSEGKEWEAVVTVVRKEMMDTPMGRVQTIVIKPETKFQGVMKKTGDSYIWLTDDDRHFIVHIEASVKIGTIVGTLKTIEKGEPPEEETK